MRLIPSRRSKKQRAMKTASKAARKAAKAKAVQKAPKTAAAVWAGRRSGKVVRVVVVAIGGALAFKALRSKLGGGKEEAPSGFVPPAAPEPGSNGTSTSYRATPTPASSQQTEGGGASGPDPAGPTGTETARKEATAPAEEESATPPHGDPLADDAEQQS